MDKATINNVEMPLGKINIFLGSNWSGHIKAMEELKNNSSEVYSKTPAISLATFMATNVGLREEAIECVANIPSIIAIDKEIANCIANNSPIVILTPIGEGMHTDLHHIIWDYFEELGYSGFQLFINTYSHHLLAAVGDSIIGWKLITFPFMISKTNPTYNLYDRNRMENWLKHYTLEELYSRGHIGGNVW